MARYFIGFLLAVGLIIVVIVLIIRALTGGPKGSQVLDLNSYANSDVTVQFTIDTPVSASDTHHDIVITVGNNQATLLVTKGYEGAIVRMKSYPTNVSLYAVFLHSLTLNGFTKGNNDPALRDERGHCALNDRFVYEVLDSGGNDLQRYWRTSCNTGTFKGNTAAIQQLFMRQIPDYATLTNDVQL